MIEKKIVKIDNTRIPAEIHISITHIIDGYPIEYTEIYSEEEIDLRELDSKGNVIIKPID